MTQPSRNNLKSKGGLDRIRRAFGYSMQGFKAAYASEHAFRQEVWAVAPLSLFAWLNPHFAVWLKALLFGSLLLILIVELLNSSIEANTDHISLDHHPLAKHAKDMGSAAVFLAILNAACLWACVLWWVYGARLWNWLF